MVAEFNYLAAVAREPAPVVVTWDEDMGWCVGLHRSHPITPAGLGRPRLRLMS